MALALSARLECNIDGFHMVEMYVSGFEGLEDPPVFVRRRPLSFVAPSTKLAVLSVQVDRLDIHWELAASFGSSTVAAAVTNPAVSPCGFIARLFSVCHKLHPHCFPEPVVWIGRNDGTLRHCLDPCHFIWRCRCVRDLPSSELPLSA